MANGLFGTAAELTDHVPIETLGELLAELHSLIGMRVSINNCAGQRLAASTHTLNRLCIAMYDDPVTKEYCRICTERGGRRAGELGGPFLYRCYAGFAAVAIPVIVEGELVAILMTSGFRVEPQHMERLEKMLEIKERELPADVIGQSPYFQHMRIMEIASILTLASKYISESGLRNNIQAQLHEKSLELMGQMQVRAQTEKLLSQAQFKALQSQINPHFLFNTLNAISQLAILENSDKTAEAIFSLSALLRRSLKDSGGLAFLSEETEYIDEYFKIKKLLYRERIRFTMQIDADCLHLRVPVFTLQPLVENSLVHGLEPKPEGGELVLAIRREGRFTSIVIRDNGLGMPKERLQMLRELKNVSAPSETSGIGIANVILRLQAFFGQGFAWNIESLPGKGTSIELFLPQMEGTAE